ncbi:MAG: hypothetical protein PWQ09_1162 [Candidatus Cloacimonadota bacterium]|jgi:hypothetical protein|nr:hypothetical protein [Candidatus Cloacimonadota bacterium]
MDTNNEIIYLKIKTQKVQSFIFKVPKLKAMLGANSLLGEFFAVDLPGLRKNYPIPQIWTDYLAAKDETYPSWGTDNINENFKKGVICSAGGHFETFFETETDAQKFLTEVKQKAQEIIPGVRFSFFLKEYETLPEKFKDFDDKTKGKVIELPKNSSQILIDNPYFYPSSEDGENPQLVKGHKGEKDSSVTLKIKEKGVEFYESETNDYLCAFLKKITGKEKYKNSFPEDLNELADISLIPQNNKIAIITIDGNAMGNRFRDERDKAKEMKTIDAMISFEKFWFEQRDTFRNALEEAIKTIAKKYEEDKESTKNFKFYNYNGKNKLPYQILMLGGDDLLLLTVPEIAFDLVKNFGHQLEEISKDKDKKLTVSAGIAFVKYSFPFSQAHELAESLLSSAKVKSRIWKTAKNEKGEEYRKAEYRNALDWHIHFPTGTEEIDEIRKQNYMLQYNDKTEILTRRPCTMEEAYKVWQESKDLYDNIPKKEGENFENSSGRNKYKGLRTLLNSGQLNAELYSKILEINKENEIDKFQLDIDYHPQDKSGWIKGNNAEKIDYSKITLNTALDVIELMDFHKREEDKGGE